MSNETLTSEQSLAANGKSFHWARRFLGDRMGHDAARLYAFCRLLDDMADGDIEDGPARLAIIREDLLAGRGGDDPAFAAFLPLMHEKQFPPEVLVALIDGLLEDQAAEVALADEAALLRYAYRVAGTVGLLMCHVLDCHSPAARAHAIDLGIAMQLTNIARDVLEDAQMGRRYIPGDWVGGATPDDIRAAAQDPSAPPAEAVTVAVGRLLDLAEAFYASGASGYPFLPWRAHLSIAVAARVYRQIGVQLRGAGLAWHQGRQVTSKATKLRCSLVALASFRRRIGSGRTAHDPQLHTALRGLPYVA
uniref:Predicted phytoene synthase CrtB n=1 Tax=uncultured bacterium MedeBAC46A06 TaxID=332275 RepID=Q4PJC9_9BACT|nr:predicted phytoene synthase CrtB [uncultured bacterium MedeBAC46A06]|tara:strand:+ start:7672 stop:8589 length:918 start_codon:yes stop_codon:yes gene_type:complete